MGDADGATTPLSVVEVLTAVFRGNDSFAEAVCLGFDLARAEAPGLTKESLRQQELASMLGRVARDVARHPRRRLLYQFVVDQSRLTNDELHQLFEFIYSYLVNALKGELAEVLSRVLVRNFVSDLTQAGELPEDLEVIEGPDISSWRRTRRGLDASSQKGADGLVATSADGGWTIHALVEIKSYRQGQAKLASQLDQHLERLHLGARIRGEDLDRDRSGFVVRRSKGAGVFVPMSARKPPRSALKLAVRPRSERGDRRTLHQVGHGFWLDELPYVTRELHEAAYLLTAWYVARGAGELFEGKVADDGGLEGPAENPYPELSPLESGFECLRRGLYEASLRNAFSVGFDGKRGREDRGKPKQRLPRADEVFARLYNGICFGVEFMLADRLLTPEEYRELWNELAEKEGAPEAPSKDPPPNPGDEEVARAHSLFSREEYGEARVALEGLPEAGLSPRKARTRRWLLGMIAFRSSRFAEALALFPGADGAPDRFWWTRDQLMLARLMARNGDGAGSLVEIEAVTDEDVSRFHALTVEKPAARALAAHVAGEPKARESALADAEIALATLRAERARRKEEGKGMPIDVNTPSVQLGIVDMVTVCVATGRAEEADRLLGPVGGFGAWLAGFMDEDPLLAEARRDEGWPRLRELAARAV